jgi:transposase
LGEGVRAGEVRRGGRDRQLRRLKLARHLKAAGIAVVEVERPKRCHLPRCGNSDPKDVEGATRTVLSAEAAGVPRSGDGRVEMVRALRGARRSAVKARVQAANLLKAMLVTAPETLRRPLRDLPTKALVAVVGRFRLCGTPEEVEPATKFALRSMPRRYQVLSEDVAGLDAQLERLVAQVSPELVSLAAVGTPHAATLLAWLATTRIASRARPPSPACVASRHRSLFG